MGRELAGFLMRATATRCRLSSSDPGRSDPRCCRVPAQRCFVHSRPRRTPRSRKPPGRRAAIRHRGWTLLTSTVDFQMPTASAVGPGARGRPPANVNRSGDTPDYSLRYPQHARFRCGSVLDRNQEPQDRRNRHPDLGRHDRAGEERCRAPTASAIGRTGSAMD